MYPDRECAPLRILILASQWPSLNVGGGIARPTAELAARLSALGHETSVLLARSGASQESNLSRAGISGWVQQLPAQNTKKVFPWFLSDQAGIADRVHRWSPHVVIAQEWQGLASLLAVQLFRPALITWLHGGTLYDLDGQNEYFQDAWSVVNAELERIQVENSDLVVSPSQMLLDLYASDYGYKLGDRRKITYHFPPARPSPPPGQNCTNKLLFVGRLSNRKGLELFKEFVSVAVSKMRQVEVIVAGESRDVRGQEFARQLRKVGAKARYMGLVEARRLWDFAQEQNAVLVVTSTLDNSPNTVYEAVSNGLGAVIVGDRNGAKELAALTLRVLCYSAVDEVDWSAVQELVTPTSVSGLIGRLNEKIDREWSEALEAVTRNNQSITQDLEKSNPIDQRVSVVIPSRNRLDKLREALNAVASQTVLPDEVVIVDDHSSPKYSLDVEAEATRGLKVRVIRSPAHLGPAEARNLGAMEATSEILAFLDDDNLWEANHLENSLLALNPRCPVVVSPLRVERDRTRRSHPQCEEEAVFLGDSGEALSYGLNLIGDTTLVCFRNVFKEAGGFPGPMNAAAEDFRFLQKVADLGYRIRPLPKPTVNYSLTETGFNSRNWSTFSSRFLMDRANQSGLFGAFSARVLLGVDSPPRYKRGESLSRLKEFVRNRPYLNRGVVALRRLLRRLITRY